MTSAELLNYTAAFCIFFVSIFLAITLYYLIDILRRASRAMDEIETRIDAVCQSLTGLYSKATGMTTYISIISNIVKKILSTYQKKRNDESNEESDEENDCQKECLKKTKKVTKREKLRK